MSNDDLKNKNPKDDIGLDMDDLQGSMAKMMESLNGMIGQVSNSGIADLKNMTEGSDNTNDYNDYLEKMKNEDNTLPKLTDTMSKVNEMLSSLTSENEKEDLNKTQYEELLKWIKGTYSKTNQIQKKMSSLQEKVDNIESYLNINSGDNITINEQRNSKLLVTGSDEDDNTKQ